MVGMRVTPASLATVAATAMWAKAKAMQTAATVVRTNAAARS
jgi:hypothetical protein